MQLRLKILHGTLKDKSGRVRAPEVEIHQRRFVIGTADDCSMRCSSSSVSPHHCEIRVGSRRASVRNLVNATGTFVNGEVVEDQRPLHAGDLLRVGRLEFEILVDEAADTPAVDPATLRDEDPEEVGDYLSDVLVQADERERADRLGHPETRQLQLPAQPAASKKDAGREQAAKGKKAARKEKRTKQPPKKLPAPPPTPFDNTEDSTEAAQEALRRLFSR